ncbi:MAG: hypothetical protein KDB44_16050 [Mycobacterium sp.]|nr:hypothetical protein [Mycobacterium sp.]
MRFWSLLVAPFLVLAGIAAAPTAAAECTTVDNMTLCSLGDGDSDVPTLPSRTGYKGAGSNQPGYSYGPSGGYDYYYDDGYRWFTP